MGSLTKYKEKELCTVKIKSITAEEDGAQDTDFIYAFMTNIPTTARTSLGIITIAAGAVLPDGTVMGCSYPKPARASKRFPDRSTSSYIAQAQFGAAKLDGWTVTRSRKLPSLHLQAQVNSLVATVYVKIQGIKYAWNSPKVNLAKITDAGLTALGIKYATANDLSELCFGATYPKPPKARKQFGTTVDDLSLVSSYYDPTGDLPVGWNAYDPGYLHYIN